MWIVIKYNLNQIEILKKSITSIIGEKPEFYNPKIKYQKNINGKSKEFKKNVLGKYILCRHNKFVDEKILNLLRSAKGLAHFLNGFKENQKDINKFIDFCKSHENEDGYLKQSFFNNLVQIKKKVQFLSGPFSHLVFDIIEDKGQEIKILANKIKMTISKRQSNLLYNYI